MPEIRFVVRWPDESVTRCYSPSLIVREMLTVDAPYRVDEFLRQTRSALAIASQRVEEKHGFPCSRAAQSLALIEAKAALFAQSAPVRVEGFEPEDERG